MKLLVHLHIYYYNQIPYFIKKLSNISGVDWELFITEIKHDKQIEKSFNSLHTKIHYMETENIGYDIWPFIAVIKSVNLDDYDLILKLHTKSWKESRDKINGFRLPGFKWRNELVNSLLHDRNHFLNLINMFQQNNRLGLVCSDWLYKKQTNSACDDLPTLYRESTRLGLYNLSQYFCAGTMFLARACLYKFLQTNNISPDLFYEKAKSGSYGSMSHTYERILTMIPKNYSYTVKTVKTNIFRSHYIKLTKMVNLILAWTFSISRIGKDRIKYITILGIRFRLSK